MPLDKCWVLSKERLNAFLGDPESFVDSICLTYRHDFGLLREEEKNKVRFECREWLHAFEYNLKP